VFTFGVRVEAESKNLVERLEGGTLQQMGGKELIPLLRAQGRNEEADTLDYTLERLRQSQQRDIFLEGALLAPQFAPYRPYVFSPGIIIHLAALTFMLALVLLVASLLYFRFRSAADPEAIALRRVMSYTPLLLFSSALVAGHLLAIRPGFPDVPIWPGDGRRLHDRSAEGSGVALNALQPAGSILVSDRIRRALGAGHRPSERTCDRSLQLQAPARNSGADVILCEGILAETPNTSAIS
jgi:hypothetical protein